MDGRFRRRRVDRPKYLILYIRTVFGLLGRMIVIVSPRLSHSYGDIILHIGSLARIEINHRYTVRRSVTTWNTWKQNK